MWVWEAVRLSRLLPLTSLICTMLGEVMVRKGRDRWVGSRIDVFGENFSSFAIRFELLIR